MLQKTDYSALVYFAIFVAAMDSTRAFALSENVVLPINNSYFSGLQGAERKIVEYFTGPGLSPRTKNRGNCKAHLVFY